MPDINPTDDNSATAEPPVSPINDQILSQVGEIGTTLKDGERLVLSAAAYQAIAQTMALSLQNAVEQQQHNNILRNAMTTAAATALLAGKKEEAEAVLKLAESKLTNPSLTDTVRDLKQALSMLREELKDVGSPPPRTAG
jgi:predicted ATPase